MKWIFNIVRAPWWGGFFERMIQLLKRCLRKIVGQAKLTYEELLTDLAEVELILNSRPLTYVSSLDIEEPLTPSHLLVGKQLLNVSDHFCYSESEEFNPDSSRLSATRRLRHLNTLLDHFRNRWRKEYLTELRENHKKKRNRDVDAVNIGDVVLIHDETPRGLWKMGRIEETIVGRDGQIRGAVVRVKSGGVSAFNRRPLQGLYPLEVQDSLESKNHVKDSSSESTQESTLDHTENTNNLKDTSVIPDRDSGSTNAEGNSMKEGSTSASTQEDSDETTVEKATSPRRSRRQAAKEARDLIVARLLDSYDLV
uniref:DUF5641 domain-containing protein n=1 Tax=Amphimedon queenslandica TaxID=400682 RepID=A0A1X7VTQ6_AMPQE